MLTTMACCAWAGATSGNAPDWPRANADMNGKKEHSTSNRKRSAGLANFSPIDNRFCLILRPRFVHADGPATSAQFRGNGTEAHALIRVPAEERYGDGLDAAASALARPSR